MMQRNSVNRVFLVGHTGGDSDVRFTQKGTAIANFSLATNSARKSEDGKEEKLTEWHKIVVFGRLAEFCEKWVKKGAFLFLEGRLQTRSWEDKDENKRYVTEVVAEQITFLGSKSNGNGSPLPETANAVTEPEAEEIPF